MAIGITSDVDEARLHGTVSVPSSINYFHVDNFGALEDIINQLITDVCLPPTTS